MLKVKNLKLNYLEKSFPDLKIKSGDFLVIKGENGIGKTSFLKVISGLENKFSGELDIGKDIFVNYVFDNYLLVGELSVFENLKIENNFKNFYKNEQIDKVINERLSEYGIYNLKNKLAKDLSSGEKQKIKFIRAILKIPDILILDEPTSHLDKSSVYFILDKIIELSEYTTIILVNHKEEEVDYLKKNIEKLKKIVF